MFVQKYQVKIFSFVFIFDKIFDIVLTINLSEYCNDANPCLNGGTCTLAEDDYQCHCKYGYSGLNCENLKGVKVLPVFVKLQL